MLSAALRTSVMKFSIGFLQSKTASTAAKISKVSLMGVSGCLLAIGIIGISTGQSQETSDTGMTPPLAPPAATSDSADSAPAAASSPSPRPSQALLLAELDKRRPDEASPFFALRERAAFFNTEAGRQVADQRRVAVYPNTAGNDTVSHTVGQFVRGLTKSIRIFPEKPARMTSLTVLPGPTFSLEDRREIAATLTITNHGNKLLALEFPTNQRFEFVILDDLGVEIARWSEDRNFTDEAGVIMVNPEERIQYTASLPTRDMVAGQNYTLRASIAGHPDFTHSLTLEPR